MVVRRSAFEAAGGFDEAMPAMQDWDLWLRLARVGSIRGLNEAEVIYRAHEGPRISTDSTARRAGLERLLAKNREFWPPSVQAFHECRLAALDYQAGRCPISAIARRHAPVASVAFMAKALISKFSQR